MTSVLFAGASPNVNVPTGRGVVPPFAQTAPGARALVLPEHAASFGGDGATWNGLIVEVWESPPIITKFGFVDTDTFFIEFSPGGTSYKVTHILLEVPPVPEGGLSDEELLRRLRALYSKGRVNNVAKELAARRERGDEIGEREASEIHAAYLARMYDLSEFMKGVTQRFTRWFNRVHGHKGTLWEERFRSVIVESGTAARTMAAYIDLNCPRSAHAKRSAISSSGNRFGGFAP